MNALGKKLTAISLAGTVGLGTLAIGPLPAVAAPVAPNQDGIKQAAPTNKEDVRRRRWRRHRHYGPAVALGAFAAFAGAIAAHRHHRHYYYGYPGPYYPAYGYYYGPRYHYYGW